MRELTPPKYGRIRFASVEVLVERLRATMKFFPKGRSFSAYATDQQGQRHYGLDYDELLAKFGQGDQGLANLKAACGDELGRSVNLSLEQSDTDLSGQFVVVAATKYGQREIIRTLQGTWEPLSVEEQQRRRRISTLVLALRRHTGRREREQHFPPTRTTESAPPTEELRVDKFPLLYDSFLFDQDLAPEVFAHVLNQLSEHFFQQVPFYVRAVDREGEPYGDIGVEGAEEFLDERRQDLRRLYAEVHAPRAEWMTLQLEFGEEPKDYRVELEVSSRRNKQIQATIRDSLEQGPAPSIGRASMIHELFSFDDATFSLEKVIRLLRSLSTRFLQQEMITGFLSTRRGETYPGLHLKMLKQLYQQHIGEVSFLLFGVNQAETGRTFSLMFQFAGHGQSPHGSLSMMWGSHGTHQAIRALIWKELALGPYRGGESEYRLTSGREMLVKPQFKARDVERVPLTALVVMPLEAYWSDSLWEQLRDLLHQRGIEAKRAPLLYEPSAREATWTLINQAELLIADLTYKHPSVFYWLGVAQALGHQCLIISQHDRDIPEDLLEFPSLVYTNSLEGMQALETFLQSQLK